MIDTVLFSDAAGFQATCRPLVDKDPDGATVFTGVLANQIAAPFLGEPPLLVAVTDGGRPLAAALRIPRYPMTVVVDPDIADPTTVLEELAAMVIARGEVILGLGGRRRTVEMLAGCWARRTGVTPTVRLVLLFHRLGTLTPPVGVPGTARTASAGDQVDLHLLARWWFEFERETGVNAYAALAAPDPEMVVRGAARGQVVSIWTDRERAVAAAGHSAVRDGAVRIAPVYTPAEFRRRGYGSAVTAAAVRSARSLGAGDVSLFTDAGYRPANEAYRRLGFEVVAEFAEYQIPGAAPDR